MRYNECMDILGVYIYTYGYIWIHIYIYIYTYGYIYIYIHGYAHNVWPFQAKILKNDEMEWGIIFQHKPNWLINLVTSM